MGILGVPLPIIVQIANFGQNNLIFVQAMEKNYSG